MEMKKKLSSPERIINFKNKIYQKINNIKNLNMSNYINLLLNRINKISKKQINKFGNVSNT